MARRDKEMSVEARRVLTLIAQGHSYEQILALKPALTYKDIFAAAEEALAVAGNDRQRTKFSEDRRNIRHDYPRAYESWTVREEDRLSPLVRTGQSVEAIAAQLQRQPTAISSRMAKLGLTSEAAKPAPLRARGSEE